MSGNALSMNRLHCLFLLTVMAGCASQAPQEVAAPAQPTPAPVVEPPERPIPEDSLYPLLVAEFALRRRAYDVALDQYSTQAPLLRDPGVSAHTTHLAQYLQEESEALQAVQLWVELAPEDLEANNTLAILLVRSGRNTEAAPHLGVVARGGGQANFPVLLNGFQQLDQATQSQLVASINDLATEFPGDTQILFTQALLHEELGQNDRALEKLDQLFKQEPDHSQGVLLEAKLLLETGARQPFKRLEANLEANPDNNHLRLQYARLLTRDDMQAAREQFEILSARAPRDADLLLSLALINREIGDNLAAKSYLRKILELEKRQDDAHFYLGRIAEDEGELQTAIYNYMKVQNGRDFYAASGRVGRILLDRDEADKLQDYFNGLRDKHPDRRERLFAIESDLLSRAGQMDASLAVLNRGLAELPESTSLRYSRSMLVEQQDNLELMESDLRAILASDPDNATALNALGYTLANRTDRYEEAYQLISRALELQPEEPAILDSMGWVLYRRGQYPEAIRYLRKAFARFPDPEVAAHLGEVLWASGEQEEARQIWQEALAKSPDHKVLVSTIRRLGVAGLETAN